MRAKGNLQLDQSLADDRPFEVYPTENGRDTRKSDVIGIPCATIADQRDFTRSPGEPSILVELG